MTKTPNSKIINLIKRKVIAEGGPKCISSCPKVLLEAASFGRVKKEELLNASVAAEFFYQAIFSHYWPGKGRGQDVILGDYYGSLAIICASKLKDNIVLDTFCSAIQDATEEGDNNYKAAGRLAKIYGASAYVGAYLAGLSGPVADDLRYIGEKTGLKLLNAIGTKEWHEAVGNMSDISSKFLEYLQVNEKSSLIKN